MGRTEEEKIVYYMAECQICTPIQPVPFKQDAMRNRWADFHRNHTAHEVSTWEILTG